MSRHLLLHKAWDDDDELLVEDASSLPLLETAAPCTLSAVKISIISRSIMCLTSTQLLVAGNQQKGRPCATSVRTPPRFATRLCAFLQRLRLKSACGIPSLCRPHIMGDQQQQVPPEAMADERPPWEENSTLSSLLTFASEQPGLALMISLVATWLIVNKLRSSGGVAIGGSKSVDREAAMEAARQRQQAQLAAAAEARLTAQVPAAPAPSSTGPAAVAPAEMPARMKAAMERRLAAERAEARMGQSPTSGASSSTQLAPPSAAPPPAAPPREPRTNASGGKRKESLQEKMARIEKGKGSSDFNPLHGKTQTGGAGLTQRKKGGG